MGLFSCLPSCARRPSPGGKASPSKPVTIQSIDNYEFLSICAENSLYGTPRSSSELHAGSVVNGVRYHPYSFHFGGFESVPVGEVPFDFSIQDELEKELQVWVRAKCANSTLPSLDSLHPAIADRICKIIALTEEEQIVEPMRELELLRKELSGPPTCGYGEIANLTEAQRYCGLDFLVIDECMHRLRWKHPRVKNVCGLMASVPVGEDKHSEGWHYEQCAGSIDVWTRIEPDGSFSVRCRSVQQQPLFNAISLIYEVDLHPSFMPHLHKATRLGMLTGCGKRAQILARYVYQLPVPFANRDTVLFAFGFNAMRVEGLDGIAICAQSIPGEAPDWWGHPVPVEGSDRMVRERVRGMSFVMRPVADGHTEMTVIANLDKQVSFIPQSIINWMIKDMVKGLYKNMIKINLKFNKTEFAQRVQDNPDFYTWVKQTLAAHGE